MFSISLALIVMPMTDTIIIMLSIKHNISISFPPRLCLMSYVRTVSAAFQLDETVPADDLSALVSHAVVADRELEAIVEALVFVVDTAHLAISQ